MYHISCTTLTILLLVVPRSIYSFTLPSAKKNVAIFKTFCTKPSELDNAQKNKDFTNFFHQGKLSISKFLLLGCSSLILASSISLPQLPIEPAFADFRAAQKRTYFRFVPKVLIHVVKFSRISPNLIIF